MKNCNHALPAIQISATFLQCRTHCYVHCHSRVLRLWHQPQQPAKPYITKEICKRISMKNILIFVGKGFRLSLLSTVLCHRRTMKQYEARCHLLYYYVRRWQVYRITDKKLVVIAEELQGKKVLLLALFQYEDILQSKLTANTWLYASPGLQSTAISIREIKKCWWTGAYSPGAIVVPYFRDSPGCNAPKLRMPVSFTSASIFPSCSQKLK